MKPKRGEYRILASSVFLSGREVPKTWMPVVGWICGNFAMRKEQYCWEFTHVPTGVRVSAPWIETRAPAMQHLIMLAEHGLSPQQRYMLDDFDALPLEVL